MVAWDIREHESCCFDIMFSIKLMKMLPEPVKFEGRGALGSLES